MRRSLLGLAPVFLLCSGCSVLSGTDDGIPDPGGSGRDGGGTMGRDGGGGRRDSGPPPACTRDDDCDDGDFCTGEEACGPTGCQAGIPPTCGDGVDCTADSCASGECRHEPSNMACTAAPGGRCDVEAGGCQYPVCTPATCVAGPCQRAHCDGDTCIYEELCDGGQECCGGACVAAGCNDGNACTDDRCADSGCVHAPNTHGCDDGNGCTDGDVCSGGSCRPGLATVCVDDGNICTYETCDPAAGACVSREVAGGECAERAHCAGGACVCNRFYDDCDGDGNCECPEARGCASTGGTGSCRPPECETNTDCLGADSCCVCVGLCYTPFIEPCPCATG